jgi:hypothetical protein
MAGGRGWTASARAGEKHCCSAAGVPHSGLNACCLPPRCRREPRGAPGEAGQLRRQGVQVLDVDWLVQLQPPQLGQRLQPEQQRLQLVAVQAQRLRQQAQRAPSAAAAPPATEAAGSKRARAGCAHAARAAAHLQPLEAPQRCWQHPPAGLPLPPHLQLGEASQRAQRAQGGVAADLREGAAGGVARCHPWRSCTARGSCHMHSKSSWAAPGCTRQLAGPTASTASSSSSGASGSGS